RNWQAKQDMAQYLGVRFLVSQLNNDDARMVYDAWTHEILSLPYGLNTITYQPHKPTHERSIDIGFRGDYYSPYVGHTDRNLLLDSFNAEVTQRYPDARIDICV